MRFSQRNRIGSAGAAIGGSVSPKTMLVAEGARYQAMKPHFGQRVPPKSLRSKNSRFSSRVPNKMRRRVTGEVAESGEALVLE